MDPGAAVFKTVAPHLKENYVQTVVVDGKELSSEQVEVLTRALREHLLSLRIKKQQEDRREKTRPKQKKIIFEYR